MAQWPRSLISNLCGLDSQQLSNAKSLSSVTLAVEQEVKLKLPHLSEFSDAMFCIVDVLGGHLHVFVILTAYSFFFLFCN